MTRPTYTSLLAIETLVEQFIDKTLPVSGWTHCAHLTVGFYFVSKHGGIGAMQIMRDQIIAYNESVGTANTDSSGYHETITQFWIWLIDAYWQQVTDGTDLLNACNTFLESECVDKGVFLKFYSRELIFSTEARKKLVLPDQMPLNYKLIAG